jgi:hypothetical protein
MKYRQGTTNTATFLQEGKVQGTTAKHMYCISGESTWNYSCTTLTVGKSIGNYSYTTGKKGKKCRELQLYYWQKEKSVGNYSCTTGKKEKV